MPNEQSEERGNLVKLPPLVGGVLDVNHRRSSAPGLGNPALGHHPIHEIRADHVPCYLENPLASGPMGASCWWEVSFERSRILTRLPAIHTARVPSLPPAVLLGAVSVLIDGPVPRLICLEGFRRTPTRTATTSRHHFDVPVLGVEGPA